MAQCSLKGKWLVNHYYYINPMKNMKTRTLFLTMIALASIALCGCGNNNATDENPPAPTNSAGSQMPPGATNQNSSGNSGTSPNYTNNPAGTN
jgi:hypothetical protein